MDCADPYRLVQFWSQLTGFAEDSRNPDEPGDPEGLLLSPDGSPALLFLTVPEPKQGKDRVHLDLVPLERGRDEEVERVLADPEATSSASSAAMPNALASTRSKPDLSPCAIEVLPSGRGHAARGHRRL